MGMGYWLGSLERCTGREGETRRAMEMLVVELLVNHQGEVRDPGRCGSGIPTPFFINLS